LLPLEGTNSTIVDFVSVWLTNPTIVAAARAHPLPHPAAVDVQRVLNRTWDAALGRLAEGWHRALAGRAAAARAVA
jgi:hypothetical protein